MKTTLRVKLNAKAASALAKRKLPPEKYPDPIVADIVKKMRPSLVKAFADVEKGYHDEAKRLYDTQGAHALFTGSCAYYRTAFSNLEAEFDDREVDSFTVPDANDWKTITTMLSTCTIVCYPPFQLSDNVTDREILVAARDVFIRGEIRESDLEGLQAITRDDLFCLREATDETPLQEGLFMSLERCCFAAARRMKLYAAREEAMMWLDLLDLLQTRNTRYDLCLRPETAEHFARDFMSAQRALVRIIKYETL